MGKLLVFVLLAPYGNPGSTPIWRVRSRERGHIEDAFGETRFFIGSAIPARLLTTRLAADGDLDEIDEMRLQRLLSEIVWFSQHIWDRQQRALFPKGEWESGTAELIITDPLTLRRGPAWWDHNKFGFPPPFSAYVEK